MKIRITRNWPVGVIVWVLTIFTNFAFAQSPVFTYQGRLSDGANPASGEYAMQFKLYDTPVVGTGTQQGDTLTNNSVPVNSGIFTIELGFGDGSAFNGAERFLEIGVKPTGNPNPFTILSPRQRIATAPYALRSFKAAAADGLSVACVNCITSGQIASVAGSSVTGTLPVSTLPAGSTNYIQNTTIPQASASFNISGSGIVGGSLIANGVVGTGGGNGYGVLGTSDQGSGVWAASNGVGLNGPALRAANGNPSGIGIWSTSNSVDANVVISNAGTGDLIRGFCANCGDPAFRVRNDGGTFIDTNAPGLNGSALRLHNNHPQGIGIYATSNSDDANVVINNAGTGDLIRGFCAGCGNPAFRVLNNGTTITRALHITGGSDLAEHFEVAEEIEPGMVVVIDSQNTGKLTIARGAYNRRAAGVVSGANNLSAGLVLPDPAGEKQTAAVTLSGRVWVYCDATTSPVEPGDLLTTSNTPGHAMKVTNHAKAQGAIIGKAMTGLKSGRGLVLLLANLQ